MDFCFSQLEAATDDQLAAICYDSIPRHAIQPDRQFYLKVAADCVGHILELGCGTGRITIPLADSGKHVVGVDASEAMLEVLRAKMALLGVETTKRIALCRQDFRKLALGGDFSLVLIPFRPLQYLNTAEDQVACLTKVGSLVKKMLD